MSDRALMQQALEALEAVSSCVDAYYIPEGQSYIPEAEKSIAALRTRLAQPEPEPEPVAPPVRPAEAGD